MCSSIPANGEPMFWKISRWTRSGSLMGRVWSRRKPSTDEPTDPPNILEGQPTMVLPLLIRRFGVTDWAACGADTKRVLPLLQRGARSFVADMLDGGGQSILRC